MREKIGFMHLGGFVIPLIMLMVGFFAFESGAAEEGNEIPFSEAEIFFELNNTDGDLGIHSSIDGDAWKRRGVRKVVAAGPVDPKSVLSKILRAAFTDARRSSGDQYHPVIVQHAATF